jgi:hypothetical protein
MDNEISHLFSNIFRYLYLWAKESYLRTIIVLAVIYIVIFPALSYLQDSVKNIAYKSIFNSILWFFNKFFTIPDYIFLTTLLIIILFLVLIYLKLKNTTEIKEYFQKGLNAWSIPTGSGWTTQKCTNELGYMLSVTNSGYPGILKDIYGWYDYEISFLAKISDKNETPNFSIIVRSENNFNGIMFQVTKTHFLPHILYNGTFILDKDKYEQLPTVLNTNEWIPVKIIVKGNNVDMWIYNYKLQYRILSKVYNVENRLLGNNPPSLQEIELSNTLIQEAIQKVIDEINRVSQMPDGAEKNKEFSSISDHAQENIPANTRIVLEYQKGSIGFRAFGNEHTCIRKLKIKRI